MCTSGLYMYMYIYSQTISNEIAGIIMVSRCMTVLQIVSCTYSNKMGNHKSRSCLFINIVILLKI